MYVCVYTCVCMYAYVCVYICMCTYQYTYQYIYLLCTKEARHYFTYIKLHDEEGQRQDLKVSWI